jgi:hypothetical protein
MTNTTLMNFNIPNQIKDDFKTVCTFNQSTMTSEIVRFINSYISQEGIRLKQYQQTSNEINELKQRKLTTKPPIPQSQRSFKQNTWENSY